MFLFTGQLDVEAGDRILPKCLDNSEWRHWHVNPVVRRYLINSELLKECSSLLSDTSASPNPAEGIYVDEVMAEYTVNNVIPREIM